MNVSKVTFINIFLTFKVKNKKITKFLHKQNVRQSNFNLNTVRNFVVMETKVYKKNRFVVYRFSFSCF